MDKKNTLIGLLLLSAGLILMMREQAAYRKYQESQPPAVQQPEPPKQAEGEQETQPESAQGQLEKDFLEEEELGRQIEPARVTALSNEVITLVLNHKGAGIQYVALTDTTKAGAQRYRRSLEDPRPYRFNEQASLPALALSFKIKDGYPQAHLPSYQLLEADSTQAKFRYQSKDGFEITRHYALSEKAENAYIITHTTTFKYTEKAADLSEFYLSLGAYALTAGDIWKEYLSAIYHKEEESDFIKVSHFKASGSFLGLGTPRAAPPFYPYSAEEKAEVSTIPLDWLGVKNQFFASILLPQQPANGLFVKALNLPQVDGEKLRALEAYASFKTPQLKETGSYTLKVRYYSGPKDYGKIKDLATGTEDVMQFRFFSGLSKLMLWMLQHLHEFTASFAPAWSWGLSIVFLTIIIKTLLWPLTNIQLRSAAKMSKVQKPLKKIQEKYKDKPKKIQEETLKIFRANGISPLGCLLPLFIQFPIFIALFFMLRTASDLRFAPFLWINDLSIADKVATIATIPIHPMAIAMSATMLLQMHLAPSTSTDVMQKRIMQLLPVIFLFFCYSFPSALTLYWTTQNLLTIFQQKVNRLREKEISIIIPGENTSPKHPFRKTPPKKKK